MTATHRPLRRWPVCSTFYKLDQPDSLGLTGCDFHQRNQVIKRGRIPFIKVTDILEFWKICHPFIIKQIYASLTPTFRYCVTKYGQIATCQTVILTHWGRVTHKYYGKLTIISPGLSPIGPLGTNFSEIVIEIYIFSFKNMYLNKPSGKCRPFCLDLNVLRQDFWQIKKSH